MWRFLLPLRAVGLQPYGGGAARPGFVQSAVVERLRRGSDVVLAVTLLAVAVVELSLSSDRVRAASYAAAGFVTLPLMMRRRLPLATLIVVLVTNLAHLALVGAPVPALGDAPNSFALAFAFLCAVYSAAAYATPRRAVLSLITACSAVAIFTANAKGAPTANDFLAALLFSVVVPWLVGVVRTRQRQAANERSRRAEMERQREHDVQAAIERERTRIARELHDIVAHSLGVIVVQAAAERRAREAAGGEDTDNVLMTIERTGRSALTELRRLLGVLRTSEEAELAPQPGVDDVTDVIATVQGAGVNASLRIEGAARALSPGVALSAYRVVQEALTNVVRHADATQAWVTLRYEPEVLVVEVVDNGGAPQRGDGDIGFGLIGMAERVSLFGGRLDFGPRPDASGFRVVATLPATAAA